MPDVSMCEFSQSLNHVDRTTSLTISDDQLQQFQHALADELMLQVLRETIRHVWPETKLDVPVHEYAHILFL